MRIAYLGPSASFSHYVAQKSFPKGEWIAFGSITEVIKAYEAKKVDYAIVPVENSIEGSVHETIDYLFHQATIGAVAEILLPIRQQLLVTSTDKDITTIFSHPQALAQGKAYLSQHYPHAKLEATTSTAYAAQMIAQHPDKPYAAIASLVSAREYQLEILARDIQEIDENYTRFWILGKTAPTLPFVPQGSRRSLALTLPNNGPGALYQAMSVFAWRSIDLTKIESRPLKTVLGDYFFIMDVDDKKPELVDFSLKELTSLEISYKTLGNYLIYTIK